MADSHINYLDHVAAANLARDLGLELDGDRMRNVAKHMAEHRASTIDLAVSRIQSRISETVHRMVGTAHAYRSTSWSDGCRSAEAEILAITSDVLDEIRPREQRSKGQILRSMLGNARQRLANHPQYHVTAVSTEQNK